MSQHSELIPCPVCAKTESYCYATFEHSKWFECLNEQCKKLFTVKNEDKQGN